MISAIVQVSKKQYGHKMCHSLRRNKRRKPWYLKASDASGETQPLEKVEQCDS